MLAALLAVVCAPGACPPAAAGDGGARPADNPLWAVSLDTLSATRERPIFDPSRRPPRLPVPTAVAQPVVAPPAEELKPPPLTLLGTVIGETTQLAHCQDEGTKDTVRLRIGQNHDGWVLRAVGRRAARFEKADQIATLVIPGPATQTQGSDAPVTKPMIAGALGSPAPVRKHHRR